MYLIRRDPKLTDVGSLVKTKKNLFYSETRLVLDNSLPASNILRLNDIIFVAEKGGGIYAKCKVIEILEVHIFKTLSEAISFFEKYRKIIDSLYFLEKLRKFHSQLLISNKYRLKFQFYKVEQEILLPYVPLTGALINVKKNQNSIIKLSQNQLDYIAAKPKSWAETDLNEKIPSVLRLQLYSYFSKQKGIGHLIDIDHFVPKSLGAPGNIIENLVPIGFSLNRYKSNSIPRGFFEVSEDFFNGIFEKEIKSALKNKDEFFTGKLKSQYGDLAKRIIQHLHNKNKFEVKDAKRFYLEVMQRHLADYAKMIQENFKNTI